jgi:hypothetical protein
MHIKWICLISTPAKQPDQVGLLNSTRRMEKESCETLPAGKVSVELMALERALK